MSELVRKGCGNYDANVEQDVFSFMTTLPNPLTASINHERMPVLLASEAEHEQWLSGTLAEALSLLRSFGAAKMRIVQRGVEKEVTQQL